MAKRESEDELTAWLQRRCPSIGDDAAFVRHRREIALTTDSQREGVHFLSGTSPADIGRRLLAVNLSDLAAVGAAPRQALCTLASPADWDRREFFEGLIGACEEYGVELVGGDLSKSSEVHTSLTVIGERVRFGRFLERASAQPGQSLWLAGTLGDSHLGLRLDQQGVATSDLPEELRAAARAFRARHRRPEPQLEIGRWLAGRRTRVAAIDVSDGFALDATRLARASGVDLHVKESALFKTSGAPEAFQSVAERLGAEPLVARLTGGEDYALIFTIHAGLDPKLRRLSSRHQLLRIGEVRSGSGRCMLELDVTDDGRAVSSEDLLSTQGLGWDHLR